MILPGVSGSVIAVILNVYEKILNSLSDIKNNIKFLIKTIIGIVVGIIIGANIILNIYNKYYVISSYIFIGLILGTIPFLIQEYHKKTKSKINIIDVLISIVLTLIFTINIRNVNTSITNYKLVLSGILYTFGKIVPGVSSTALLSCISMYDYYLNIFANPIYYVLNNFDSLIFIIIGILISTIILIKLLKYLFDNYYEHTYSMIIGFTIGSVMMLYPHTINILGVIFLIISFLLSFLISINN